MPRKNSVGSNLGNMLGKKFKPYFEFNYFVKDLSITSEFFFLLWYGKYLLDYVVFSATFSFSFEQSFDTYVCKS